MKLKKKMRKLGNVPNLQRSPGFDGFFGDKRVSYVSEAFQYPTQFGGLFFVSLLSADAEHLPRRGAARFQMVPLRLRRRAAADGVLQRRAVKPPQRQLRR